VPDTVYAGGMKNKNDVKLNLQRALLKHSIDGTLVQEGFHYTSLSRNPKLVSFALSDSNGWSTEVWIRQADSLNHIYVNGVFLASRYNKTVECKLVAKLRALQAEHTVEHAKQREAEYAAARWQERKAKELGNLPAVKGVDISIITSGKAAGNYGVALQDGNPLENLTLAQVQAFHLFLKLVTGS